MRLLALWAICLSGLIVVTAACTSDSNERTPTLEAPRATATWSFTPIPTGAVSRLPVINSDNATRLMSVSTGKLEQQFETMQWRADGQAVFVASRQAVFVLQAAADSLTKVYEVPAPAAVLDVAPDGKAAI